MLHLMTLKKHFADIVCKFSNIASKQWPVPFFLIEVVAGAFLSIFILFLAVVIVTYPVSILFGWV